MKAIFRILGTAAAVAATGAAIVIMDKLLNEKAAPIIESIEFPEEAEKDDADLFICRLKSSVVRISAASMILHCTLT